MVTYRNAYDTQICVWAKLPTQICVSYAFHDMCLTLPMQRVLLNSTIIKIERLFANGDVIAQPNKVTNVPDWIVPDWIYNNFNSIWVRLPGRLQLSNPSDLACSRSSDKFQGHTGQKIADFDPNWAFPDGDSSLNSPMALKWCTKLDVV